MRDQRPFRFAPLRFAFVAIFVALASIGCVDDSPKLELRGSDSPIATDGQATLTALNITVPHCPRGAACEPWTPTEMDVLEATVENTDVAEVVDILETTVVLAGVAPGNTVLHVVAADPLHDGEEASKDVPIEVVDPTRVAVEFPGCEDETSAFLGGTPLQVEVSLFDGDRRLHAAGLQPLDFDPDDAVDVASAEADSDQNNGLIPPPGRLFLTVDETVEEVSVLTELDYDGPAALRILAAADVNQVRIDGYDAGSSSFGDGQTYRDSVRQGTTWWPTFRAVADRPQSTGEYVCGAFAPDVQVDTPERCELASDVEPDRSLPGVGILRFSALDPGTCTGTLTWPRAGEDGLQIDFEIEITQ